MCRRRADQLTPPSRLPVDITLQKIIIVDVFLRVPLDFIHKLEQLSSQDVKKSHRKYVNQNKRHLTEACERGEEKNNNEEKKKERKTQEKRENELKTKQERINY